MSKPRKKDRMVTGQPNTQELLELLSDATFEFCQLALSFDEQELNIIPYDGSWTAAQVVEHVTRSNVDITKQLSKPGKICHRQPDAEVQKIRLIFLDFNKKLASPEFILPTRHIYGRQRLISELQTSIDELRQVSEKEDLLQLVNHTIFGEITRLETLYFVVYHTQRHIHQLKNIQTIIHRVKQKRG